MRRLAIEHARGSSVTVTRCNGTATYASSASSSISPCYSSSPLLLLIIAIARAPCSGCFQPQPPDPSNCRGVQSNGRASSLGRR
eukprot:3236308-Pyramimonas_sp.AAC.2